MKTLETLALLTALVTCHVGAASAQVVGSGELRGQLSFAVKKCGTDRGRAEVGIVVAPDGTWTAGSGEGLPLSGTSLPLGMSGRKLALAFDAASAADFAAGRAADIEAGCRVSGVVIESATPTRLTLALNRKRTKATLVVIYKLTASAGGKSTTATFKINASGRWKPV
jgi:hypothetical protein